MSFLAVDLDGTLLARSGLPHDLDVRALQAARDAGITVTIITGRLFPGTNPTAQRIGLDTTLGCADGSHLVHTDGTTLAYTSLRGDELRSMHGALKTTRVSTFLLARDRVFHDESGVPFLDYVRTWSPDVHHADDVLEHDVWAHDEGITAIVGVAEEEPISVVVSAMRDRLSHAASVISFPLGKTGLHGFLARTKVCDKGTALLALAAKAGVAKEKTVAVGDWLNDLPMFRAAGTSFCMGQAPGEVRDEATHVLSETVERGGGIAAVVRDHFGIKF
ncbi:MAG: HAD hydrolase family protein [Archangium sp.]|nr:HAD hydrolase family protein [Archangium sp.]